MNEWMKFEEHTLLFKKRRVNKHCTKMIENPSIKYLKKYFFVKKNWRVNIVNTNIKWVKIENNPSIKYLSTLKNKMNHVINTLNQSVKE